MADKQVQWAAAAAERKGQTHSMKIKTTFQWPQVIRLAQLHIKATSVAEQHQRRRLTEQCLFFPQPFLVCEISKQKEKNPKPT